MRLIRGNSVGALWRGLLIIAIAMISGACGSSSSVGLGSGGCSTQGVGGDSVAPVCASQPPSSSSGIQPPVTVPGSSGPVQPGGGSSGGLTGPPELTGTPAPSTALSGAPPA